MPNDEYEFDSDQSPRCFIHVGLPVAADEERFLAIVADFANRLGLHPRPAAVTEAGRVLPSIYVGADFILSPTIAELPDPTPNYGQVHLELRRRSFPHSQFTALGHELMAAMRAEFGAQVRIAGTD